MAAKCKVCGGRIFYKPLERTVCAGCELRGGRPPDPPEPVPVTPPIRFPEHLRCRCGKPILDVTNSGRRECMACQRETLAAQGRISP